MALRVTRVVLDAIRREAATAAPRECCGILLGQRGTIEAARPAANVADDPVRQFEIEPEALIDCHRASRAGGPQVIGYYHSHPAGAATPSATDRAQAAHDGRVWAIAALDGVTFWRDGEGGFETLSYVIEDR